MTTTTVPPEPPVGTHVRDRHGAHHTRFKTGWASPGMMAFGNWALMWEARGPLVEVSSPYPDPAPVDEQARAADEWEDKWRRIARQPLTSGDETEAWRIARYALVGQSMLDADAAVKLSAAYLRLLAQVGRAGLPEED